MSSKNNHFLEELLKHVVCIGGVYKQRDNGKLKGYAYSAFVMSRNENVFLVTAGHCLASLKDAIEHQQIEIVSCNLIDYVHPQAVHKLSLPFRLSEHEYAMMDKDGIDIGIVKLNQLEQQSLIANKIQPFSVNSLSFSQEDEFCFIGIIGFPDEYIKLTNGNVQFLPTLSPVVKVDFEDVAKKYKFPIMSCKLIDNQQPQSLEGVSGGPVFAFKEQEGKFIYEIIGIQSEWLRESRIAIITPFQTVIEFIKENRDVESK
ncbi:MAG: hypothetical protein JNJ77_21310 [Planctomycetia bacterium]|nr:hypothetical protein [Planctomycetia bacterium]